MVMFEPSYLSELIDIGERDAEAREDELVAFVEGTDQPADRASVTEQAG